MRYKRLGNTGLLVSELAFGTMTFGGSGEMWRALGALDQAQARELLRLALDAGVNLIDTADAYAEGESERILGQALRDLGVAREEVLIATKVFGPMGPGPNCRGNSRGHILNAVEASLTRLQTEYIDVYQIHGFDPVTPIEESLRALETLIQRGSVRYVGVSNWAAWQIVKALGIQDRLGYTRFSALQAYYTLASRDLERELAPMMRAEGVGLLVWSPLASGLLAGKYEPGAKTDGEARRKNWDFPPVDHARVHAVIEAMQPIAAAHEASLAQVAIAWLLHQPVVSSVILGARRPEQLVDTLASANVALSERELGALDEASRLAPEYPGWMLEFFHGYRAEVLDPPSRGAKS
jgi:aryl-alcohol dehydrogenase-like predicted oxidoreductase